MAFDHVGCSRAGECEGITWDVVLLYAYMSFCLWGLLGVGGLLLTLILPKGKRMQRMHNRLRSWEHACSSHTGYVGFSFGLSTVQAVLYISRSYEKKVDRPYYIIELIGMVPFVLEVLIRWGEAAARGSRAFERYVLSWSLMQDCVIICGVYGLGFSEVNGKKPWFAPTFVVSLRVAHGVLMRWMGTTTNVNTQSLEFKVASRFLSIVCWVYFAGASIHIVENLETPHDGAVLGGQWTLLVAIYYVVVSISTVGYGDWYPVSHLGRAHCCITIATGLAVFSSASSKLMEMYRLHTLGITGVYVPRTGVRFVVVTGSPSFSQIQDLIAEVFHPDHSDDSDQLELIFLLDSEPLLERFNKWMSSRANLHLEDRVRAFHGNPLDARDLMRVKIGEANAVFVLPELLSTDPVRNDSENVVRVLSIRRWVPTETRVICLIHHFENRRILLSSGVKESDIISIDQFKLELMGKTCQVPGFSTMICNLCKTIGDESDEVDLSAPRWQQEYDKGLGSELYEIPLSNAYRRAKFGDVCADVLRQSAQGDVYLVGLVIWEWRRKSAHAEDGRDNPDEGRLEEYQHVRMHPGQDFLIPPLPVRVDGIFIATDRDSIVQRPDWQAIAGGLAAAAKHGATSPTGQQPFRSPRGPIEKEEVDPLDKVLARKTRHSMEIENLQVIKAMGAKTMGDMVKDKRGLLAMDLVPDAKMMGPGRWRRMRSPLASPGGGSPRSPRSPGGSPREGRLKMVDPPPGGGPRSSVSGGSRLGSKSGSGAVGGPAGGGGSRTRRASSSTSAAGDAGQQLASLQEQEEERQNKRRLPQHNTVREKAELLEEGYEEGMTDCARKLMVQGVIPIGGESAARGGICGITKMEEMKIGVQPPRKRTRKYQPPPGAADSIENQIRVFSRRNQRMKSADCTGNGEEVAPRGGPSAAEAYQLLGFDQPQTAADDNTVLGKGPGFGLGDGALPPWATEEVIGGMGGQHVDMIAQLKIASHRLKWLHEARDLRPHGVPVTLAAGKGGHILLCSLGPHTRNAFGVSTVSLGLRHFVRPLRMHSAIPGADPKAPKGPAVVVLAPVRPCDWNSIAEYDRVYFVEGSPLNIFDLERASFRNASAIFVNHAPPEQQVEHHTKETYLMDAEAIFAVKLIESNLPKLEKDPGDPTPKGPRVISELIFDENSIFIPVGGTAKLGMTQKPAGKGDAHLPCGGRTLLQGASTIHEIYFNSGGRPDKSQKSSASMKRKKKSRRSALGGKVEDAPEYRSQGELMRMQQEMVNSVSDSSLIKAYYRQPRFAAGELFVGSVVTCMVANSFYNPALLLMIRELMASQLLLVTLPELGWEGKTYFDFHEWLLWERNLLALGIYRTAESRPKDLGNSSAVDLGMVTHNYFFVAPPAHQYSMLCSDRVLCLVPK